MADKQQNAANYDPSVPPGEQRRHRGRRCCCCLFRILWWFLVFIIVLAGLVILVTWIILQPRFFKYHVTEAKLTQFNYTASSNTLRYNLVLNFTARNPNKKLNIYYDKVEAHAFYEGTRFGSTDVITWLNSFRQYTKSTDRMSGVFSGQHVMVLDRDQISDLERDERDGVFDIDVKLYFRIRFRLGDFIGGDMKPKAKCALKVPFRSNGTAMTAFEPTKCDVNF
ncbi:Late embryogenesis abundant protein [Sesbania bispinosa]|nr:Late embryogenesis abundant protein [Sesbania bispinosa]